MGKMKAKEREQDFDVMRKSLRCDSLMAKVAIMIEIIASCALSMILYSSYWCENRESKEVSQVWRKQSG